MSDNYIVEQGPERAFKVLSALIVMCELEKDPVKRADFASRAFMNMMEILSKEDLLALQTSFVALREQVTSLGLATTQYIDLHWGIKSIETLSKGARAL